MSWEQTLISSTDSITIGWGRLKDVKKDYVEKSALWGRFFLGNACIMHTNQRARMGICKCNTCGQQRRGKAYYETRLGRRGRRSSLDPETVRRTDSSSLQVIYISNKPQQSSPVSMSAFGESEMDAILPQDLPLSFRRTSQVQHSAVSRCWFLVFPVEHLNQFSLWNI